MPWAAPSKPNFVFVLLDDVGYNAFSPYGGVAFDTPNFDALARGGMGFTQCHSRAMCAPSRQAFTTGKHLGRGQFLVDHLGAKVVPKLHGIDAIGGRIVRPDPGRRVVWLGRQSGDKQGDGKQREHGNSVVIFHEEPRFPVCYTSIGYVPNF